MGYIAKEPLVHKGDLIEKGQAVEGLDEAQLKRLVDLDVVEQGTPAPAGEQADQATQESHSILDRAKAALGGNGQPTADQVAADANTQV
jgi:hypothetical protein